MTWRVAKSLEVLLAEVNAAAPNRSKASDGSIGNAEHSSRESDHNPNPAGVVRARDFTHDPSGGFDAYGFAEDIRDLGISGHPALTAGAYVISRSEIASATHGWAWRPYGGSNPHDHHTHVSVATATAGYDSTAPWLKETDDMTPEQDARLTSLETKVDVLGAAVAKLVKSFGTFRDNEWRRDVKEAARLQRIEEQTAPEKKED